MRRGGGRGGRKERWEGFKLRESEVANGRRWGI